MITTEQNIQWLKDSKAKLNSENELQACYRFIHTGYCAEHKNYCCNITDCKEKKSLLINQEAKNKDAT